MLAVAAVSDRRMDALMNGGSVLRSFLMPERLKRLDIVYQHRPIYFVTACAAKRRKLLANEAIHGAFKAFANCAQNCGAWVGAYVFMPDHVHFFVAIDDEQLSLSVWMKSLKGTLSSKLREQAIASPYWQRGFFDHLLRTSDSYSQKWNYVRENPVRAGLATCWQEWPYLGEIFDLEFHNARF